MVIDYRELKIVVDSVKFKYGERINYVGLDYLLFPFVYTKEEREEGKFPVFFNYPTVVDWDIYFGMNAISKKFRKAVLLHEIVESERVSHMTNEEHEMISPHEIAVKYEDVYAKDVFNKEDYIRWSNFLRRIRRQD